ncbi:gamma-glutamylcyclotransferase a isoform X2 [Electrophorus electricus]|uniref:gamma-glutamylcyclotransferase a isoform X2 n=1 Tax=Electrophorus electricus TaxID=8005 RepID=UPI0015D0909E|nr:gamma-glutamylcyclotransferase a isoform X2 [Electrophorus electricus]
MSNAKRFMYFAYGSNLLKERLQLENPSAVFRCVGRLKGYVLNFGLWGDDVVSKWHGGVATIEKSPDEQEQVDEGAYSSLELRVETEAGPLLCRTYQMNKFRPCPPSPQYKKVVCLGARETGLPQEYLKKLQAVETNGYTGSSILDDIKNLRK